MAERPIFVPEPTTRELVKEIFLSLVWNPGFAVVQKEKNIEALHKAAVLAGYKRVLEVSTKSLSKKGRHLSAFHLKIKSRKGVIPLECVFQGSKVFEGGGPYRELFAMEPKNAKKDPRLKESGALIAFEFEGVQWPLEPKTAFYDWLYSRSLYPHRKWAQENLDIYDSFSDIEFNPFRSVNCQARSLALFLSLMKRGELDEAVSSPQDFIRILRIHKYHPQLRKGQSLTLFA